MNPTQQTGGDRSTDSGLVGLFAEATALAVDLAALLDDSRGRDIQDAAAERAESAVQARLIVEVQAIAQWVSLQRAARRGEISADRAQKIQTALGFHAERLPVADEMVMAVSPPLFALAGRAADLQRRIRRIEAAAGAQGPGETWPSPVAEQIALLRRALGV